MIVTLEANTMGEGFRTGILFCSTVGIGIGLYCCFEGFGRRRETGQKHKLSRMVPLLKEKRGWAARHLLHRIIRSEADLGRWIVDWRQWQREIVAVLEQYGLQDEASHFIEPRHIVAYYNESAYNQHHNTSIAQFDYLLSLLQHIIDRYDRRA
jgi:hypothetical protein